MEALLLAALIYVATKIGEQVTDKASTEIANGLETMAKMVFKKVRDDPAALQAAQEWQQKPRDAARIRRLQLEVERLRRSDEGFDERLRAVEDSVGSLLDQAAAQVAIEDLADEEPLTQPPSVAERPEAVPRPPPGWEMDGDGPQVRLDPSWGGVKADLKAISDHLPRAGLRVGQVIKQGVAPLSLVLESNDNTKEIFAAEAGATDAAEAVNVALTVLQDAIERYVAER